MSDDDFLYDEDDDLYFDEFPYIEADDLATHTMQSPVWMSYDLSYETASIPSDWEYYSDDYWDEESTKKRKINGDATAAGGDSIGHSTERRQGKLKRTEDVPGLSLGEPAVAAPTVVWKSKNDVLQPFEGPIVCQGQGERVSLLKDWRERFKIPSKRKHSVSRPIEMQRTGRQKAVAVVVNSQFAERVDRDTLPPTTLSNAQGTSSATNRTTRATSFQYVQPQVNVQTQSVHGASSAKSRKRKERSDSSGTPPTADRASSATFKKEKVASNGGDIKTPGSQKPGESHRSARRITALGTGKGGLEVSDVANREAAPSRRRKRKAESEIILSVQPSKRNTWVTKPSEDIANETRKDAGLPPSRRSNRKRGE